MNYVYDAEADALYIKVAEADVDRQVEMADGVIVDVATDGQLVGIDVMNPSSEWDVQAILDTFQLVPDDETLVRRVASQRSWSPLRQPRISIAEPQMTGHHEPPVAVEELTSV
jgi:uncharacterized protein YuzE